MKGAPDQVRFSSLGRSLQKTEPTPWPFPLSAIRLGKESEEFEWPRKPTRVVRGLQRRAHLERLPAIAAEDRGAFGGRKLERGAGAHELIAPLATEHLEQARRNDVADPVAERRLPREVGRENADVLGAQIDEQTLTDDEDALCRGADLREKRAAPGDVGEIHRNALENAARVLSRERLLLIREQLRQVDLDPAQGRRQRHAIGARVEAGRDVEYCINSRRQLALDVLIEDVRPHHPRP